MARSRNLKPGYFTNEVLATIDPFAHILYSGLWTVADRDGRLEDRPAKLKIELLPCRDCDVDALLSLLASHGLIRRYSAHGGRFIDIPKFGQHQSPHQDEKSKGFPSWDEREPQTCTGLASGQPDSAPADSLFIDSLIPSSLIPDSLMAPNGASSDLPSNGKSTAATSRKAVSLSEFVFPTTGKGASQWTLPQDKLDEYLASYPGLDVLKELRAARQWCRDNPRNRKTAGRMLAFLTGWMNRSQNSNRGSSAIGSKPPRPSVDITSLDLGD